MIPFIDLKPAHSEIRLSIDAAIDRVRDSGIFLNGPEVEAFEEEWAKYCGAAYCVACASGTDALTLAVIARCGGMQFIQANTLSFTEIGLQRGIENCGWSMNPIVDYCDCDERGWPDYFGCVPVLLYGRHLPEKFSECRIVDACQAHGWHPSGFQIAAWSFYPTKNLGSFGDAGAVTTNSVSDFNILRREAKTWHSRMSEINAAVLRTKLPHLDRWNAERAAIAEVYYNELPDWAEPACRHGEPTNHHIFAVLVDRRNDLLMHLAEHEIQTRIHYEDPLAELPGARRWCDRTLSLPMYPGLTPKQVQEVCDTIRSLK